MKKFKCSKCGQITRTEDNSVREGYTCGKPVGKFGDQTCPGKLELVSADDGTGPSASAKDKWFGTR